MTAKDAYTELSDRLRQAAILSSAAGVLGWDERTYMPRAGGALRAEQLGLLSGMIHEQFTSPRIGELLSVLERSEFMKNGDSLEAANIRETRYDYDKQTKLPKELVEEISKVTTLAQGEWVKARQKNDFKAFQPWLEKVLNLSIRKAEALGYEGEPYNALLDNYEKGMTVAIVADTFEKLRQDLVTLLGKIKDAPKRPDVSIVERDYDTDLQRVFGESVAQAMGYNFNEGRLDITTHPFCSGLGPGDTRITTRYNPKRLNDALFGIMHEAGHGLYEMGLQKEKYFGQPVAESASLGVHESQSRLWENQVGRSLPFWRYFFPQAQRIFKSSLGDVKIEAFYAAINNVAPSYIRVEADEVTYNLHILLRFELERAMIKGDLKPTDVPGEWNSRFKKYFGIAVDTDRNGCLQDVHWSAGLFGYFPTYSLGTLMSAQFFAQALKEMPDLMQQFERGEFTRLREWLRTNIHQHGTRYRAPVLLEKVTGQKLSHRPLMDYMTAKFSEIYGF
jgi:carboxypeptidase Taq